MLKRKFGTNEMEVTVLGYGAMELPRLSPQEAEKLLNEVLDRGINFIDTSPCYGISEEYVGLIADRRQEFYLSTKCGCVIGEGRKLLGHTFDRATFEKNIEHSLRVMKTDHVDILQIHAPTPEQIPGGENDDMIRALYEMKAAGKIGHVSITFKNGGPNDPGFPDRYSFDHLMYFKDWKVFDTIQVVYGGLTRKCELAIEEAARTGKGIIARGSMKNYFDTYPQLFERSGLSALLEEGESKNDFLLRYTITHPGVTTAIVGTASQAHLLENIAAAEKGPLAPAVYEKAKACLDSVGLCPLPLNP